MFISRPKAASRFIACFAVLALVVAIDGVGTTQAAGYRVLSRRTVAPGVVFVRLYDPAVPEHIFVLDVDLSKSSTLQVAAASRSLGGIERTSSMAARRGAIAAVNGDFGGFSGRPTHLLAERGALQYTSIARWGLNVGVSRDNRNRYIGRVTPTSLAWLPGRSTPLPVDKWNSGPPGSGKTAGFTSAGTASSPRGYCGVQLSHPGPRIWTHHRNVVGRTYRVVAVRCKQPLSTKGSVVLAAGRYSVPGAALRRLRLGQYVKLTWTVGWRDMLDTVGGDPLLVTRGVAVAPASCPSYFCDRNPRTGVGFTPAGHALLVVVDGRRDGWSDGMTLLEFANLFVYLGATRALNLDGGGSSTMVVGGRVVNRPSDGQERWVSSAVLVMPGQGSGSRTRIAARTLEPAPEAPRRSIDAALVDPGSTGGMLDAIQDGAFGPPPRMTTQEGAALRAYRNAARRGGAP